MSYHYGLLTDIQEEHLHPATIKKDFNLRIYCKLKNLFYICYIDHLIISTNSN